MNIMCPPRLILFATITHANIGLGFVHIAQEKGH